MEQQEVPDVPVSKPGDEYIVRPDGLEISHGGYEIGEPSHRCLKVMVLSNLRLGLPITGANCLHYVDENAWQIAGSFMCTQKEVNFI